MGLTEKYELWKKRVKDRKLLRELLDMSEAEINSAFYKDLEFGTAGIRGTMGVGTNRINIYTIRKITQGVVLYMINHRLSKAVISYDSRLNSGVFAKEAAKVLAAAGFIAYVTPTLMPTPYLSFAVRNLNADVGIMITASHNPAEYNGYKVYDSTGCQIIDEAANEISELINQVDAFRVKTHSFDYYVNRGNVLFTDENTENDYMAQIDSIAKCEELDLSVVYTPLNGTGYRLVPKMLEGLGCKVLLVEGQSKPNGRFPTCPSPNPEKKEALRHGIKLLKSSGADVLIATDPDADRIGVAYIEDGEAVILSGNEMGALMCEYLLTHTNFSKKPLIVRTLVSTDLVDKMAQDFGAEVVAVPTGFKYIGNVINGLQNQGDADRFLLGFEESQGYLVGVHVRDKDAVIAAKIMSIIAAELRKQGKTLGDKLKDVYAKYGNYAHRQFSYKFEGEAGEKKMKSLLLELREKPLVSIANKKVHTVTDYLKNSDNGFPPLNMISYEFEGGKIIVRPSGTEPLIKLYASSHLSVEENEKTFRQIKKQFGEIFK